MKKLIKIAAAVLISIASLPIALAAVDSVFGLGSISIVPSLAVGAVFTLTSPVAKNRAWWFAFTVTCGLWMCLCPAIQSGILSAALLLQDLIKGGNLSGLSWDLVEGTSLLLTVAAPFVGAVASGVATAKLLQRWTDQSESRERWQLSTRELLIGTAGIAILLGTIIGCLRRSHSEEQDKQSAFLSRFESSFISGNVSLSGSPRVQGLQRMLVPESGYGTFLAPGVNEYRVIAPINRNGTESWGLWVYTCNDEHDDLIYQFAYAEAEQELQLPTMPFPAKAYVNGTWTMVDGVPR